MLLLMDLINEAPLGKLKPKIRGALVLALGISAPIPDPSAATIQIKFLPWIINVHVKRLTIAEDTDVTAPNLTASCSTCQPSSRNTLQSTALRGDVATDRGVLADSERCRSIVGYLGISLEVLLNTYGHHHPDYLSETVEKIAMCESTGERKAHVYLVGLWSGDSDPAKQHLIGG